MNDTGPWNDYPAPTATPPIPDQSQTKPWEDYSSLPISSSPPEQLGTFPEPQVSDNPPAGEEKPIEQRLAENAVKVGTAAGAGFGAGSLLESSTSAISSLFETPESLKSAGITANALEHMAPGGQNPADYVQAVEKQLQDKDVLATTAKETWDKMYPEVQKVGQVIGKTVQQIKSEAANISDQFSGVLDPTVVDAEKVLQPLSEEIAKRGTGIYSGTQATSKPFIEAYQGLMNFAKQQGGKLTLENIDPVLKETGAMMDQGEEARALYGPVYGRLADVRDAMVNTIAQQAKNPELAQTLLKNNADYSTYMRVLPSVEKAAYREAVKEGVSAYQKYVGPLGEKLLMAGGAYGAVKGVIDKVLGNH